MNESPEEIAALLTQSGLEVEHLEPFVSVPGGLAGLVIGEVLTCVKHPDADKLSLTTVDIGQEQPSQIVCGASNVAAGQKVVVATVGATLYPSTGEPFEIKKAKNGDDIIELIIKDKVLCLSSKYDPTKEASRILEDQELDVDFIFILGGGHLSLIKLLFSKIITTSLLALSVVFFTSCNEGNASSKVKKENVDTAKKRDTEISKGAAEIQFDITEYDDEALAHHDHKDHHEMEH